MLRSLRNIPRESRVMVVVSLTVLLQVLVLSGFGLAALKGREAESEREMQEICRRVLAKNLVEEVARRVETAEKSASEPILSLGVLDPKRDGALAVAVQQAAAPNGLFRRAFLIDSEGSWFDRRQRMVWPARTIPVAAVGGDSIAPFEDLETRIDAGLGSGPALEEVERLVEEADEAARPYGLLLLARLQRRDGQIRGALAAYDEICRKYPTALDVRSVPPVLVGPEAARRRARERLAALRIDQATAADVVTDIVDLRHILLINRFQMDVRRAEWEASRLRDIAETAAAELPALEDRVRLDDGLAAIEREEEALLTFRRVFGEELNAVAKGSRSGGRLSEVLPAGPRVIYAVPIRDRAGNPTGAVMLELHLDRIRLDMIPEMLSGLPLPDGVAATLLDSEGRPAVGGLPMPTGRILAEDRLGDVLPFYRPVVYLRDPEFAERQTASVRRLQKIIMGLSIAGILAAGWFVVRTVKRELKVAKLQSDFLSNVTHELKTPLTSIRMFVETLQDGRVRDPEEQREYLDVISREADRLGGLIQRVLDLTRLERKHDSGLKRRATDLGKLAEETADIFRMRMGESGARLEVAIPSDLPTAAVDPGAMQEMILNLLSNALKYGATVIRFSVSVADGGARLVVEDDGIGISEEDQKRIFEKFYRADDRLARNVEGSGLGLALVREIARAHGGRVRVASKKGNGSRFTVTVPLR